MEIDINTSEDEDGDKKSGADIPYSVIALSLFLLSWQASFRVPDTCIGALLTFIHHFLLFLSALVHSEQLSSIAQKITRNIKQLRTIAGIDMDSFTKFVVCPLCHSIYDSESCILMVGSRKEVKKCQHISFPYHPHANFRKRCDQALLKKVQR